MEEASVTQESPKNKPNSMAIGAVAVLALGLVFYFTATKKPDVDDGMGKGAPTQVVSNAKYKDGVYSVVGGYKSPAGDETIHVKLTLKDNLITEADVVSDATKPMSMKFQKEFVEGYKQFVIGKNINEVKLDKVSGSSLTPKGFNDAVEQVKAEAKV